MESQRSDVELCSILCELDRMVKEKLFGKYSGCQAECAGSPRERVLELLGSLGLGGPGRQMPPRAGA